MARGFKSPALKTRRAAEAMASTLRSRDGAGDGTRSNATSFDAHRPKITTQSPAEPRRRLAGVITYHNYYKAPTFNWPAVTRPWHSPICFVESSRARQTV